MITSGEKTIFQRGTCSRFPLSETVRTPFLCKSSVSDCRSLAKLYSAKTADVKNTIISNLMISAAAIVEEGDSDCIVVFGNDLMEFCGHLGIQNITCFISPTDEEIIRNQPQTRTSRLTNSDFGASGQDPSPPMAAFEFLLLMGILTERGDARQALINSGRGLSRAEQ